jgi:hypothetical protein
MAVEGFLRPENFNIRKSVPEAADALGSVL